MDRGYRQLFPVQHELILYQASLAMVLIVGFHRKRKTLERTQFSYTGLVNNPILGAFIPYTPLGVGGVWNPTKEHYVSVVAVQSKGDATTSGFDNFNGEYTYGGQYQFSPTIGGNLPGNYRIVGGYTNKDVPRFDIDPRHLIGELIGVTPVAQKSDNYTVLVNFDQYLWIEGGSLAAYQKRVEASGYPGVGRHHLPPDGIGIFGRAGWAPKDRNVIDQFYSFGIGGYGMLPGRDNDQWGIGWAGTHISSDLRDDVGLLGIELNSFEHAFEAFYNIQVTPAAHLTVNSQVIDPALKSLDTAFTLGARLQIDF
jgi:porin